MLYLIDIYTVMHFRRIMTIVYYT